MRDQSPSPPVSHLACSTAASALSMLHAASGVDRRLSSASYAEAGAGKGHEPHFAFTRRGNGEGSWLDGQTLSASVPDTRHLPRWGQQCNGILCLCAQRARPGLPWSHLQQLVVGRQYVLPRALVILGLSRPRRVTAAHVEQLVPDGLLVQIGEALHELIHGDLGKGDWRRGPARVVLHKARREERRGR